MGYYIVCLWLRKKKYQKDGIRLVIKKIIICTITVYYKGLSSEGE